MSTFGNAFSSGFVGFFHGIVAVARAPLAHAAWLVALAVSELVAVVWGSVFAFIGWLECRKRLTADGLIAIGEVLAPRLAREQYAAGVWTGLWRVHTLTLAFVVVQLPTLAFVFAPAVLAQLWLGPAANPGWGVAGLIVGQGLPALVALGCAVLAGAELFLAARLLAGAGPTYSVGLVAAVTAAAWRATLTEFGRLMGLAAGLLAAAVGAGVLIGGSVWLASLAKLGGAATWILVGAIGAPAAALFAASVYGALADWSAGAATEKVGGGRFSLTRWLREWLAAVFGWFADAGVLWVGVGVCLVAGGFAAFIALRTFDWVPLGVFAASAAVLVILRLRRT